MKMYCNVKHVFLDGTLINFGEKVTMILCVVLRVLKQEFTHLLVKIAPKAPQKKCKCTNGHLPHACKYIHIDVDTEKQTVTY